jgi:hypothetical protein
MSSGPGLIIDELIVPGLSAQAAEQLAQDLHQRLTSLETADRVAGLQWRQPQHAVSLTIECGARGDPDPAIMAAAIRAQFLGAAGVP